MLLDIAGVLDVPVQALSEGAEHAVLDALRTAAISFPKTGAEIDRAEEMTARFPGWAGTVAAQAARIAELEQTVTALGDRLTHDPYLQASMHEVLSAATGIRSVAAILADPEGVSPEWLGRFHRNILDDANRLVDASRDLVQFLDAQEEQPGDPEAAAPPAPEEDEAEAFLAALGPHIPELEAGEDVDLVLKASALEGPARETVVSHLERYKSDAARLSMEALRQAMGQFGLDPLMLAAYLEKPLDLVLRRMAHLPPGREGEHFGLIIADGTGKVIYRRPLPGFSMPRFEAACPVWPIQQALAHPGRPVSERVTQLGRQVRPLNATAIAVPRSAKDDKGPVTLQATMLLAPEPVTESRSDTL